MLTVQGSAGPGRGVFSHQATQLVVRDAAGNPVVVVIEHGGTVCVYCAGDADFDEVARLLKTEIDVRPVTPRGF